MKFKKGQTVRIAPIARKFYIGSSDIGGRAVIYEVKTDYIFGGKKYNVLYFINTIDTPIIHRWAAREMDMEPLSEKGEQLLFEFMKE